ncbi:PstS family phosphate ABC transporter substrate-binding protein [Gilvimarinus sp. F26214L]|uniref:PstS family phosphate ABC transporter substrate-binding protein n=1 Tax=Gilvimarinus sp. DZF01 TaxID=3461371 RepID=UPI0040467120
MKKALLSLTLAGALVSSPALMAQGRDYISIVGSSTVYPFSTVVAERFGRGSQFKTPKVESTGSGGGLKLFCQGIGVSHPDIANASRRIKQSEVELCERNGVKGIVEVLIGYDGIVIANSRSTEQLDFSRKDLYLALAKQVPDPKGSGEFVANPYRTWKDVNPALPATAIEVMGPPPTSGTRDAFVELVMEEGCNELPAIAELEESNSSKHKQLCRSVREDGRYVEAGENDNLIVQKLEANPKALGIFGFSFLDQNSDKVQGSRIDGTEPTFDTIAEGSYPVSRPLYFYVKKAHVGVVPGIRQYLEEFTRERAWGDDGYLADKGMIPLSREKRREVGRDVKKLNDLQL